MGYINGHVMTHASRICLGLNGLCSDGLNCGPLSDQHKLKSIICRWLDWVIHNIANCPSLFEINSVCCFLLQYLSFFVFFLLSGLFLVWWQSLPTTVCQMDHTMTCFGSIYLLAYNNTLLSCFHFFQAFPFYFNYN